MQFGHFDDTKKEYVITSPKKEKTSKNLLKI